LTCCTAQAAGGSDADELTGRPHFMQRQAPSWSSAESFREARVVRALAR